MDIFEKMANWIENKGSEIKKTSTLKKEIALKELEEKKSRPKREWIPVGAQHVYTSSKMNEAGKMEYEGSSTRVLYRNVKDGNVKTEVLDGLWELSQIIENVKS